MPSRCHLAFLHRWVLALLVMSLGAAAAAPLVHPRSMALICASAGVVKVIVHTDDGAQEQGRMAMDCPLCSATGAPPVVVALHLPSPLPLAYAVQSIPSARIAAATQAPLPARGPPPLS